jgi:hypothetical protein
MCDLRSNEIVNGSFRKDCIFDKALTKPFMVLHDILAMREIRSSASSCIIWEGNGREESEIVRIGRIEGHGQPRHPCFEVGKPGLTDMGSKRADDLRLNP